MADMLDFERFGSMYYSKIIVHNSSFIVDKIYIIECSPYFVDMYLRVGIRFMECP